MQRDQTLDGLRALAALSVLAFHVRLPGLKGGFVGVDVFFVLSGYLITRMLADEFAQGSRIDVIGFWLRRAARLVPALVLVLVAVAVIGPSFFPEVDIATELIFSGLYVSNLSQIILRQPVLTAHTWSLAIEMQYYLVWPCLLIVLLRHGGRHVLTLLIGAYVGLSMWHWLAFWHLGWVRTYYGFDTHSTGLLLGGIVALVKWQPAKVSLDWLAIFALLVLAFAAIGFPYYMEPSSTWGATAVEVAAAVLIVCAANGSRVTKFLGWSPLARLGLWSYALYLWHYPIARYARDHFETAAAFGLTLGLSVALAALSFELYEKHTTRLLRALLRREATGASAVRDASPNKSISL